MGSTAPATTFLGNWAASRDALMARRTYFSACDVAKTRRHLLDITAGRCRFGVRDPLRFLGFTNTRAHVGQTWLQYLTWNCETECETATRRPPDLHLVLHIPLKGAFEATQGGASLWAEPGKLLLVGSPGTIHRRWQGPCELLNLVIDRSALARILAADFGVEEAGMTFPPALIDLASVSTLSHLVETIIGDLAEETSLFSDARVGRQAERTLLHVLLKSLPHSYSDRLRNKQRRIAPYYVKRAEEFMRERIEDNITMRDLAAAAGVSPRSVYYGFKTYRSNTPMSYLKTLRLGLARTALLQSRSTDCRVAQVAAKVGYSNPSQFSRDYRGHFGERPIETLRAE